MDRVYITGAKGMLGKAAVPIFSRRYEVFPRGPGEPDVTDEALIAREILGTRPRLVLHFAAMTDVDACELDPAAARRVNADGARNVAAACRAAGAAMVYIGTGMVYDGRKETAYVESDPVAPVNVYARTKLEGENAVRDLVAEHYLFYSCWLFGGGRDDKKFTAKIVERARRGGELPVVDDKFGSPTYTVDLAEAIFSFVESGLYGKYHCVNEGCVSRFDMAEEIVRAAGITGCRLVPASSDTFPLPAPRGRMEALRNRQFELLGRRPMRGWREALAEYVGTTFR